MISKKRKALTEIEDLPIFHMILLDSWFGCISRAILASLVLSTLREVQAQCSSGKRFGGKLMCMTGRMLKK